MSESDSFSGKVDLARRASGLRQDQSEENLPGDEDELILESDEAPAAFSMVSADRRLKAMLEFRFINGNAKALAYSYLIGIDLDPSSGIRMDFSGYEVQLTGRNLLPLFSGLVAQRVAVVSETDDLQAEATFGKDATVVTRIVIERAD